MMVPNATMAMTAGAAVASAASFVPTANIVATATEVKTDDNRSRSNGKSKSQKFASASTGSTGREDLDFGDNDFDIRRKTFNTNTNYLFSVEDWTTQSLHLSTATEKTTESLTPDAIEPNIFQLPLTLSASYRPIPTTIKVWISSFSLLFTAIKFHNQTYTWKSLKFWCTLGFTSLLSIISIQETLFAPSRIDTTDLIQNKWLPSTLSKFSTVTTQIDQSLLQTNKENNYSDDKNARYTNESSISIGPMAVHYLQYDNLDYQQLSPTSDNDNNNNKKQYNFDAIHFNHGFGASSLSWLPTVPSLVSKLGAKIAIAHDAPGFGFTDRPKTYIFGQRQQQQQEQQQQQQQQQRQKHSLAPYSAAGSASLGNALLLNKINYKPKDDEGSNGNGTDDSSDSNDEIYSNNTSSQRVALFGHSMGCASTLRMALSLPKDLKKTVVLVAPALLGSMKNVKVKDSKSSSNVQSRFKRAINNIVKTQPWIIKFRSLLGIFGHALRSLFVDSPMTFFLKRLVA